MPRENSRGTGRTRIFPGGAAAYLARVTDDAARADLLGELSWRGLLHDRTERVADALAAGPLGVYCGFDPTGPSLHVGNLTPIMALVHMQRAGHRPVALVGGGSAMIGDPSGKSSERVLLDRAVIEAHADAVGEQLARFLEFSGPAAARVRDNAEWLLALDAVGFLRNVGKHFSVNYMMAKDSVRTRLEAGGFPSRSSRTCCFRRTTSSSSTGATASPRKSAAAISGATLQPAWSSSGARREPRCTASRCRSSPRPPASSSGRPRRARSGSNAARTSPYQFYQFWVNADDGDVGAFLRRFTLFDRADTDALAAAVAEHPERREAQRRLAFDVTARVHGEAAARVAEEVSALLFGRGDPAALSEGALAALAAEIPFARVPAAGSYDVLDLAVTTRLAPSKGAARRLLDQGGLSINGKRLGAADRSVSPGAALIGQHFLLRKGARDFALVRAEG